jgi:hypothetical protein
MNHNNIDIFSDYMRLVIYWVEDKVINVLVYWIKNNIMLLKKKKKKRRLSLLKLTLGDQKQRKPLRKYLNKL